MLEELGHLVYTKDEQLTKEKDATIGFKGLKISAKVVEGNVLEEILKKEELVR